MMGLFFISCDFTSGLHKDILKAQNLLSNQIENHYWSSAWNNYVNNPTNAGFTSIVKTRLKSLLLAITQLSEYQLM